MLRRRPEGGAEWIFVALTRAAKLKSKRTLLRTYTYTGHTCTDNRLSASSCLLMPSYADEYAARQAGQTRKYKGPVRITISRGDLVLGADGTARYEEMWEEEEAMETDLVDSVDEELCGTSQASSLHNSFPNLGGSLLVLDT